MKPTITLLLLLMFTAVGCMGPDTKAVIEDIRGNPGPDAFGIFLKDVPFFAQDDLMCGPAALASVIGYWGYRAGQSGGSTDARLHVIAREVYNEKLEGTLPMDILIYAKRKGFAAEYYEGGLKDLKDKLDEGTPLILFLNLGLDAYPVGHYIVAVGYNDRLGKVLAHSGLEARKLYSYKGLVRVWSKTGFSTLLVRPARHAVPARDAVPANPRTVPEEGM
jgi:hypothetical protein